MSAILTPERVGAGQHLDSPHHARPAAARAAPRVLAVKRDAGIRFTIPRVGRQGPPGSSRQRCHTQVSVRPRAVPGYLRG